MRNYEKEVLSMSAKKTYELVNKYFIYSCPSSRPNHKIPIFITFRQGDGGEMEYLYKINDKILEFNCTKNEELEKIKNSGKDYIDRLLSYIDEIKSPNIYPNQNLNSRYYILDPNDIIKLEHKPKPETNNSFFCYYKISEFMSGNKIIHVESD